MAKLPEGKVVDLNLPKRINKNRRFALRSLEDLNGLNIAERIRVIQYALTDEQQRIYEDYTSSTADLMKELFSDLPTGYSRRSKRLIINNTVFSFASSLQAQGLLSAMFSGSYQYNRKIKPKDFLDKNHAHLNGYDIHSTAQLRSIKSFIKKKTGIADLFVNGCMNINPRYLK